jgi:hypothetical protein
MKLAPWFVMLAACSSGGSGGDDAPDDLDVVAAGVASGTIAGTTFTLGTRFMNISGSDLFVDLLPVAATDCTLDETDGKYPFIIFSVPPMAGRYPLDLSRQTVTFVDKPSNNLIVSQGVIVIDTITTNTMTGGLHVFNSEFGEVNGRFDGPICFSN